MKRRHSNSPSWYIQFADGTLLTARVVRRGKLLDTAEQFSGIAITTLKPDKPIYLFPRGSVRYQRFDEHITQTSNHQRPIARLIS